MITEMTPQERRAEARKIADTLLEDDLLRGEVYMLLDIDPEQQEKEIEDLEEEVENLKTRVETLKDELAEALLSE